jgi:hypothetical protein
MIPFVPKTKCPLRKPRSFSKRQAASVLGRLPEKGRIDRVRLGAAADDLDDLLQRITRIRETRSGTTRSTTRQGA